MSIITSFFGHVAHLFDGTGKHVVSFLDSLADTIYKNGGQALIDAATKAVIAVETPGTSGADKFEAAKAIVVSELHAAGIAVVTNAVHSAIEGAVANLNAAKV